MNLNTCIDNKYIYQYLSDISNPKGIIHICHGMAEHIKRYKWLINKLNKDGFHVISIDHRGHGNRIKNSLKGYFSDKNGWIHVVEDQINLINETKNKYPNLNQYMIAHSMGSWIGLAAVQKNINIKGLILSGSSKPPPFLLKIQKALIKTILFFSNKKTVSNFLDDITLGQYNKYFKPNRTPKDWISSDDLNVNEYVSDPLCGYKVTNGLWEDLVNGLEIVFNKRKYSKSNPTLPIFIISGSKDPVGENGKGAIRLHNFLNDIFDNVSIELVEDARHEVFSEVNKEDNYKSLINFLKTI